MDQTIQYKGLFYKHKTSHKFYEGGAHFSYFSLVKALNEIKNDLNNNRERDLSSLSKEKDINKDQINDEFEIKEKIEIKKMNIPLLSKQKNKSMNYLLDNNKKSINDILDTKKKDTQLHIINNNNKIKIIPKAKKYEYSNSVNRINKINKYFNNSVYNNKNSLSMPKIINQKIKNDNKTNNNNDNNKILKKNRYLEPLKNKYNNHIKMSSTIGFNENDKYFNYYLINNYNDFQNKVSRNKKLQATKSISQSLNKYNNNTHIIDKINIINNYKQNKNINNFTKNMKLYNANSIDYNINDNYILLNNNKNNKKYYNEQKLNGKTFINDDRNKERMNMSIINFAMLKNNKKFFINKNKY